MRATFAKALGLVLALALALSGCNLIGIDPKMQADEDIAKIDKDYSKVAATYAGGEVTVADAVSNFYTNYNQTAQMYAYFGLTIGHDQVHGIIEDSLTSEVRNRIAAAHYDEGGNALSDEELADVEETARTTAETNLEDAEASAAGENDEERAENARVLVHANGADYDALYAAGLLAAKSEAMEELLRDDITELSDEELQAAYDEKVEEQQSSFTDGSSLENAMTGDDEIVCWIPDGYRTVKHILIKPDDATQQAYSDAATALSDAEDNIESLNDELASANDDTVEDGERTAEEIQADIDAAEAGLPDLEAAEADAAQACLDAVKDTTDDIYSRLEAGESFEDLMDELGEDPGMQNEPTKSRGYYVSSESTNWEANFRDAAMALNQVGDYTTEPVVSGSGVHIIMYTGDVAGGEVPLEDVHDALYDEALETAKEDHATETIDGWVGEVNPTYDVDAFEAAVTGAED